MFNFIIELSYRYVLSGYFSVDSQYENIPYLCGITPQFSLMGALNLQKVS